MSGQSQALGHSLLSACCYPFPLFTSWSASSSKQAHLYKAFIQHSVHCEHQLFAKEKYALMSSLSSRGTEYYSCILALIWLNVSRTTKKLGTKLTPLSKKCVTLSLANSVDQGTMLLIHQRLEVPGGVVRLRYFDDHVSCFRCLLPTFARVSYLWWWIIMKMMAYLTV